MVIKGLYKVFKNICVFNILLDEMIIFGLV